MSGEAVAASIAGAGTNVHSRAESTAKAKVDPSAKQ